MKASGIEALVRGTLAFGLLTVDAAGWKRPFQAMRMGLLPESSKGPSGRKDHRPYNSEIDELRSPNSELQRR